MKNEILLWSIVSAAALAMAALPAAVAATSSSDFPTGPDKSMAAAHESFLIEQRAIF